MKIEIDVEQFANDIKSGKSIGGANGALGSLIITSPINNLNYSIILYGKNRCKKIITQRVV